MKFCKHISPQGRLCRAVAEFDYKNLDFCIDHISPVQEDDRVFDRALICLKYRTRQEVINENKDRGTISSFVNWAKREKYDIIRDEVVDHSGEATTTSYTWDEVVNTWRARFSKHKK